MLERMLEVREEVNKRKEKVNTLLNNLVKEDIEASPIWQYNSLLKEMENLLAKVHLSPDDLRFNVHLDVDPAKYYTTHDIKKGVRYRNGVVIGEEEIKEMSKETERAVYPYPYFVTYFAAKDFLYRVGWMADMDIDDEEFKKAYNDLRKSPNRKSIFFDQIPIRCNKKEIITMYEEVRKAEMVLTALEKIISESLNELKDQELLSKVRSLKREFSEIRESYSKLGGDYFVLSIPSEEFYENITFEVPVTKYFLLLKLKKKSGQGNNNFLRNDGKGLDYIILEEVDDEEALRLSENKEISPFIIERNENAEMNKLEEILKEKEGEERVKIALNTLFHTYRRNTKNIIELSFKPTKGENVSELEKINALIWENFSEKVTQQDVYRIIKLQEIIGRIRGGEKLEEEEIAKELGITSPSLSEESKKKIRELLHHTVFENLIKTSTRIYNSIEDVKMVRNLIERKDFHIPKSSKENLERLVRTLQNQAYTLQQISPIFSNQRIKNEVEEYKYTSLVERYLNELRVLEEKINHTTYGKKRSGLEFKPVRVKRDPARINLNERSIFDYLREFENSIRKITGNESMTPLYDVEILSDESAQSIMGENKLERLRKKINHILELKGNLVLFLDADINKEEDPPIGKLMEADNLLLTIPERIAHAIEIISNPPRGIYNVNGLFEPKENFYNASLVFEWHYNPEHNIGKVPLDYAPHLLNLEWLAVRKLFPLEVNNDFNTYEVFLSLLDATKRENISETEKHINRLFFSEDPHMGLIIKIKPEIIEYLRSKYNSPGEKEKGEYIRTALRIAEQLEDENVVDYVQPLESRELAKFFIKTVKSFEKQKQPFLE